MQKRLNKRNKSFSKILVACLLLLLVLILFLRNCSSEKEKNVDSGKKEPVAPDSGVATVDTASLLIDTAKIDSNRSMIHDSVTGNTEIKVNRKKNNNTSIKKVDSIKLDSLSQRDTFPDTIIQNSDSMSLDSTEAQVKASPCTNDTSELWVYPNPSGGLHRSPQAVRFNSNRVCTVQWRMNNSSNWVEYTGGEIQIEKTGTLYFFAVDTCGNRMEIREEYYKIEELQQSKCPDGMEHVLIGETSFCMDTYEDRKSVV